MLGLQKNWAENSEFPYDTPTHILSLSYYQHLALV